jgi:hypothetical protein
LASFILQNRCFICFIFRVCRSFRFRYAKMGSYVLEGSLTAFSVGVPIYLVRYPERLRPG